MALLFRFRRNFLLKVLTDVITKGLMFLFALLVARGLRSEGFGAFSSAQSVAAIVAILSDLGLNTLVTREIAARRGHAPSLVGNLLALKILLSMGVLLILGALTLTGTYADLALPLMLSGAFMVLWSTLEFFSSVVCGFERMEWETALKGGGRLLVVAGGGGALALGLGLNGLLTAMLVGPALLVGATVVVARRRDAAYRLHWERRTLREALSQALPLSAIAILFTLFVRVDIVLLEALRGDHREIGIYAAAIRVIDALGGIPLLFSSALFPIYSDLVRTEPETVPELGRGVLRALALLAVPVTVAGFALAPWGMGVLFGREYADSATALRILLCGIPLLYMNVALSSLVIAAGQQRPLAAAAASCFLLNVAANLVLIPAYGFRGAAAASVLTDAVLLVLLSAWILRRVVRLDFPRFLWRYGVAGVAMAATLQPLAGPALPLAVVLALAVYVGVLWVSGELGREDLGRLRRLVGQRREALTKEAGLR